MSRYFFNNLRYFLNNLDTSTLGTRALVFENSYPSKSHSPFLITEALVPRVIRIVTCSVGRYYFIADFYVWGGG